jgi:hypothetical protein
MHGKAGTNKWLQVADRCWKQTTIERKLITSWLQERKTKQLFRWTLKHPDSRRKQSPKFTHVSLKNKKIKIKTHSLTLHDWSPMAFTLHHKKYKTEENTKNLTSKKRFRNQTKTKQNKTEFKKRKKKLLPAIQNSFQHNLQKKMAMTHDHYSRSKTFYSPGKRPWQHRRRRSQGSVSDGWREEQQRSRCSTGRSS